MKKILRFLIFAIPILSLNTAFSQPGCPAVDVGNDSTLPCNQTCATIHATAFSAKQTTAYSVDPIPYTPPFSFSTGIPIFQDDVWSDIITLPFNFCYFGNSYNQIVVGANGEISFNIINTNQLNRFQIIDTIPATYWSDIRNCIMGPWQDIDPTNHGQSFYQIIGTYPCRMFEVSWYQVPYYKDSNSSSPTPVCPPLFATQQIVLYETTNVIEMYIQNKEVCPAWNNGLAIQGIQNDSGTIAYTVPGRNATVWTAQNDAWRFTPAGAPNYAITWFNNGTQIGVGDSLQVCPLTSQNYVAQAVYTNCDGSTNIVTDTVLISVSGINISIDSIITPTCHGDSDGALFASFTTGTIGVDSFGWTPGGAGQTFITGLSAGAYVFYVNDSNSCVHTETVLLNEPEELIVNVPDSTSYTCNPGLFTGYLGAYPSGGDTTGGHYSYIWNTAVTDTFQSLTVSAIGYYTVTVLDAVGCSGSDSGLVNRIVTAPVFDTTIIKNISCFGSNDGSIIVKVNQAIEPINYVWTNNPSNNDTITGLAPNSYSVIATDAHNCSASASYIITEPSAIVIGNAVVTPVNCLAGGTISVTATGGTGTLSYSWSNSDTGTFVDSLVAGLVILTVSDENFCTDTAHYNIAQVAPPSFVNPPLINDVSCNDGNNGRIEVRVTGGSGLIEFIWSNQTTGAVDSNLTAGCYSVTVMDAIGCWDSITYCITEPPPIAIDSAVLSVATCQVGGSICIYAGGGTGALSYLWGGGQTLACIDSLAAGPYDLSITDQNLCRLTNTYVVTADTGVVYFDTASITHVRCYGDSTGSITARANGGTGSISFHWVYGNADTSTISGLPGGAYSVTITDSVGCSATNIYFVNQPPQIVPVLSFAGLICPNQTGSAAVSVSGGTPGYTYLWNNFNDSTYNSNLFPGRFSVTVTDAIGCSASVSDTLRVVPDYNVTSVVKSFPCESPAFGNDTITVSGGIGPYMYMLVGVDTNSTGVFNNLPSGNYTWVISDSIGCSKSSVFTIPENAGNDVFEVTADSTSCFGALDGTVTINPLSSNGPYSYSIDGGAFGSGNTIAGLSGGTHIIVANNTYGCSVSLNAEIPEPVQLVADANPDTIITAPGADNAITVTVQNFQNPVFTWTPATGLSCTDCSNPTANVNEAAIFYVTVSQPQTNNCSAVDSVIIIMRAGFSMPNAFTPNDDGKNDDFGPVKSGFATVKEFRIYNRWGEMVHNATGPWNGMFNNKPEPPGTYVFYILVETPDDQNPGTQKTVKTQGSFSLIR